MSLHPLFADILKPYSESRQHDPHEEMMHYLEQILSSPDARRVLRDAMFRYSAITLGRDRAIAEDIVTAVPEEYAPDATQPVTSVERVEQEPRRFPDFRDYPQPDRSDGDTTTWGAPLRPGS